MAKDMSKSAERERKFNWHSTCNDVLKDVDLTGKTVLITGTTSGIGVETARSLALHNAHVVMANRNLAASEKLKSEILQEKPEAKIDILTLDLSSLQSVKTAAEEFLAKKWPLDVLILNAAIYSTSTTHSIDGLETTFAVNHLGHFYLTQLLLDKLRRNDDGKNKNVGKQLENNSRIIVVSSHNHNKTGISPSLTTEEKLKKLAASDESNRSKLAYRLYSYSKLCNILFAFKLHKIEHMNGIDVNVLHPGTMIPTGIARGYGSLISLLYRTVTKPFSKTVDQGAATNVYCAVHPELNGISGRYFDNCWDDERSLQANLARDEELQDALWAHSKKLIDEFLAKTNS